MADHSEEFNRVSGEIITFTDDKAVSTVHEKAKDFELLRLLFSQAADYAESTAGGIRLINAGAKDDTTGSDSKKKKSDALYSFLLQQATDEYMQLLNQRIEWLTDKIEENKQILEKMNVDLVTLEEEQSWIQTFLDIYEEEGKLTAGQNQAAVALLQERGRLVGENVDTEDIVKLLNQENRGISEEIERTENSRNQISEKTQQYEHRLKILQEERTSYKALDTPKKMERLKDLANAQENIQHRASDKMKNNATTVLKNAYDTAATHNNEEVNENTAIILALEGFDESELECSNPGEILPGIKKGF